MGVGGTRKTTVFFLFCFHLYFPLETWFSLIPVFGEGKINAL